MVRGPLPPAMVSGLCVGPRSLKLRWRIYPWLRLFQVSDDNSYACTFVNHLVHRGANLTVNVTTDGQVYQEFLTIPNPGDRAPPRLPPVHSTHGAGGAQVLAGPP